MTVILPMPPNGQNEIRHRPNPRQLKKCTQTHALINQTMRSESFDEQNNCDDAPKLVLNQISQTICVKCDTTEHVLYTKNVLLEYELVSIHHTLCRSKKCVDPQNHRLLSAHQLNPSTKTLR